MEHVTEKQINRNGWVYCPAAVIEAHGGNCGQYIRPDDAATFGATNIRDNRQPGAIGKVADWPQHYFR